MTNLDRWRRLAMTSPIAHAFTNQLFALSGISEPGRAMDMILNDKGLLLMLELAQAREDARAAQELKKREAALMAFPLKKNIWEGGR